MVILLLLLLFKLCLYIIGGERRPISEHDLNFAGTLTIGMVVSYLIYSKKVLVPRGPCDPSKLTLLNSIYS